MSNGIEIAAASALPMSAVMALLCIAGAVLCPQPARSLSRPRITVAHDHSSPAEGRGVAVLAAVFFVVFGFLIIGRLSIVVAVAIVVATTGLSLRALVASRKRRKEEQALIVYLGAVSSDLRAGASLPLALGRAVTTLEETGPGTAPSTMCAQLRTAAVVAERGGSFAHGLKGTTKNLAAFGALCAMGERHGIGLAGLFEQYQKRLEGNRRHRQATAASLQGPQTTAIVLTLLPLAGIAMGGAMGARPLGLLFGGGLGGILLVVGVGLSCAGFAWSQAVMRKAAG